MYKTVKFDYTKLEIELKKAICICANNAHETGYYSVEYLDRKMEAWYNVKVIMATDEGTICGLLIFGKPAQNSRVYFSLETFVNPDFRGKGIFERMISNFQDYLGQELDSSVINFPNSQSLRGFVKRGFNWRGKVRCGVIPLVGLKFRKNLLRDWEHFESTIAFGVEFSAANLSKRFSSREDVLKIKIGDKKLIVIAVNKVAKILNAEVLSNLEMIILIIRMSFRGYRRLYFYGKGVMGSKFKSNANWCTYPGSEIGDVNGLFFHMI